MSDELKIAEIRKNVEMLIKDGEILKQKEPKFVQFFMKNSYDSLESAKLLFKVSTDRKIAENLNQPDFNGLLWVINSSYYSMFYAARALLESIGVNIKAKHSIHAVTFSSLVYYFYTTGKLQKSFVEDFRNAETESAEILGREKAESLLKNYSYEMGKRSSFTYELGNVVIKSKAETSLERAKLFNVEVKRILKM